MVELILVLSGSLALAAAKSEDSPEALPLVSHTEAPGPGLQPVLWKTGVPVRFLFARNTEKAPYLGAEFAQDVEPAGRFMTTLGVNPEHLPPGWIHGKAQFDSPLVIALVWPADASYRGEQGWKRRLSRAFGNRTGTDLSRALLDAGFDGIVTVTLPTPGSRLQPHIAEIVDLTVFQDR